MTSPEQSKPEGEAPPHRYGTPRYCSAIETTLECVGGGAAPTEPPPTEPLLALGLDDTTGATVLESAWAGACCCWVAILAASSRRSWACRAASCACSCAIWPRIDESSARRVESCPWIEARSEARSRTSAAASAFACLRRTSRAFTSLSKCAT